MVASFPGSPPVRAMKKITVFFVGARRGRSLGTRLNIWMYVRSGTCSYRRMSISVELRYTLVTRCNFPTSVHVKGRHVGNTT